MTRYTCASCKRRLEKPFITIQASAKTFTGLSFLKNTYFGPVCATRMGLVATKNRAIGAGPTRARGRYFTENQMELFDDDAGQAAVFGYVAVTL